MQSPSLRLLGLVACHVACGIAAVASVNPPSQSIASLCFFALIFSESGLLGFWGASAPTSGFRRLIGAAIGVGYLFLLTTPLGQGDGIAFKLLILTTFTVIYGVFVVVRKGGRRLVRIDHTNQNVVAEAFQFAIRDLMGSTAAAAVFLAVFRQIDPRHSPARTSGSRGRLWPFFLGSSLGECLGGTGLRSSHRTDSRRLVCEHDAWSRCLVDRGTTI